MQDFLYCHFGSTELDLDPDLVLGLTFDLVCHRNFGPPGYLLK